MNIIEIKTSYEDRYVKSYILPSKEYYILVDSGIISSWNELSQKIKAGLNYNKNTPLIVINTHEHWDHIGLNSILLKEKNSIIVSHKAGVEWIENHEYQFQQSFEAFTPELIPDIQTRQVYWKEIGQPVKVQLYLTGNEVLKNDDYELNVICTPGHSPGSICLFDQQKGFLFSGDTVQGCGFFGKLPLYTNVTHYLDSLEKLKRISPCAIYGGHTNLIHGRKNVKNILDEGVKTIESIGRVTKSILKRSASHPKLSEIVKNVCEELNAIYSIHAFFSVLAHINHMAKDNGFAADIADRYIKQRELKIYSESYYE